MLSLGRLARHTLGIALSVGLLWLFLGQTDLTALERGLADVPRGPVVVACLLSIAITVYRTHRWGLLVRPLRHVPHGALLSATAIGFLFTTVLPGRSGEVVRPGLLARSESLPFAALFGTVVLERLIDLFALGLLLSTYVAFFGLPVDTGVDAAAGIRVAGGLAVGTAAAVLGGFSWVVRSDARRRWIAEQMERLGPGRFGTRLREIGGSFARGFGARHTKGAVLLLILHTIGIWAMTCALYLVLLPAAQVDVPPRAVVPLLGLITLGVMVPTPAAIGSFHQLVQFGLTSLWSVPREAASVYAILAHAVAFIPPAMLGGLLLLRLGGGWGSARRIADAESESRDVPDE